MINFNELLANDLAEYLDENQAWFLLKDYSGNVYGLNQKDLKEAIESYFSSHQSEPQKAALLRSRKEV